MVKYLLMAILGIVSAFVLITAPYFGAVSVTSAQPQSNSPVRTFETPEKTLSYLKVSPMMNYSRLGENVGNISDIEASLYGNNTYVALIASNSTERNHVYIQLSRVHIPTVFGPPVELTNSSVNVNASHLGIAAFNNTYVYVIWQDTNLNGSNSIYISTSSDSGQNFKTYKQSGETSAKDPKIVTDGVNVFFTWLQDTKERCGTASLSSGIGSNMTSGPPSQPSCHSGFGHGAGW